MIQMSIIGRWKELIKKDKNEFRELWVIIVN